MRTEYLPVCRPAISEKGIAAVVDVLKSGWITTGPRSAEFESRFCEYIGAQGTVALASGTAGMHLILEALGIGPGDEVVTPSMTWVSTVNLIVMAGATPVFCDVDRDTLTADPASIEHHVTDRTKLIIPVHFAGAAADLDGIHACAAAHGITVIEDAAHSIGARYRGQPIGHSGTSIFSFHPIKNITTGEGGAVCSYDPELLDKVRRLRFHGLGVDAWDRTSQGRKPQAEVQHPGFKYNMTDISAALGLSQLEEIDKMNQRRQALAELYLDELAEVDEILPLKWTAETTRHAWSLFVVRLDLDSVPVDRDQLMLALKERNIGAGLHFKAVHEHAYYRNNPQLWRGVVPNTEWNSSRILSLPLFPAMTDDDVHLVVHEIKEVLTS